MGYAPDDAKDLTGEDARERDDEEVGGTMKGFDTSKGPVTDRDLVRRFDGDGANATPLRAEEVKGVFTSERARCLLGVFGVFDCMIEERQSGGSSSGG